MVIKEVSMAAIQNRQKRLLTDKTAEKAAVNMPKIRGNNSLF